MHRELFKEAMRIVGMLESREGVVEFWRVLLIGQGYMNSCSFCL